jgi:hypothetical protein
MFLRSGAGAVLNQSIVLKDTQCRFVVFDLLTRADYDVAGLGSSQPTYSCKTRFPLYRNSS